VIKAHAVSPLFLDGSKAVIRNTFITAVKKNMNRFRKHSLFNGMPKGRMIGFLALMGFVLFVAFRIFTPPTEVIQRVTAPDGSREARLQHVFYYSDPGYKISTRTRRLWHTALYLP